MLAVDTSFVSLAQLVANRPYAPEPLAGPARSDAIAAEIAEAPAPDGVAVAPAEEQEPHVSAMALGACACAPATNDVLRDVRLFRAALADIFDSLTVRLAHDLAREVLGRELRLAPVDITSVAQRLVADCWRDEPLRLRVAASDQVIACGLPWEVDPQLASGDAILECRAGSFDARLQVRLANVLAELS